MEKEKEKKQEKKPEKKGGKFKFNPIFLVGAAAAGLYFYANKSSASTSTTTTSGGSNTTTSGGSNTTTANNNQSTTPSNVLEGSLPSVPSSSTQSSQPQASSNPIQYISTVPAYATISVVSAHVFTQPTVSSSLATTYTPNGVLNQGDVFQVVGFVNGDAVDNKNAKWWVSQWGNYVWTGDTVQQPDPNMQPLSASQIPSNGSSYPSGTGTTPQATQPSSAQPSTTPSTTVSTTPSTTVVTTTPSTTASSIYVASFPSTILVNSSNGVNVRSGPGTSYPLSGSGTLPYNATFMADAYVYGDNVNGENRWWKDNFNNYIWVGATKQKPASGLSAATFFPPSSSNSTGFVTTTPQAIPTSSSASTTSGIPAVSFTITPSKTTSQFPMTVHVNVAVGNVRSGPGTNYTITSQLVAGDTFTAVNAVDGQSVSGISRWWYSSLGHYVWEGDTLEKA